MCTVITALNRKGGAGKTSTCFHLSGAMARLGKRVLLLDNDPQASLTQGFWTPDEALSIDPDESMAAIYDGSRPFPSRVIRPTGIENIDIIPGSDACDPFNVPEPELAADRIQRCVREFLGRVRDDYDLVLIDCQPTLYLCTWAALVASDTIVIPVQPENFGAQGIRKVNASIDMVRGGPNPRIHLAGYLLSMVAKESMHQAFEQMLRQSYGEEVFAASVPRAAGYKEAVGALMPVSHYKPKSAPAKAMNAVAEELLSRIATGNLDQLREAV